MQVKTYFGKRHVRRAAGWAALGALAGFPALGLAASAASAEPAPVSAPADATVKAPGKAPDNMKDCCCPKPEAENSAPEPENQ